jgi:phosphate transport system protein
MDIGLEKLKGMILDMGQLSQNSVKTAIEAYTHGVAKRDQIFARSEELRMLQDEVSELAVELIARYQPVATDLRFIKSCMEIAYGFSRFGRYAYDISEVLELYGDLSRCDKSEVEAAGRQTEEMIRLSIKAFTERDVELAKKLGEMDDVVDNLYRSYVRTVNEKREGDLQCFVSGTLVLRYLERIADHAEYVGDSVVYTVTGERVPRL